MIGKLRAIHALINCAKYVSDVGDNWKTPAELMAQGGDCEDFAIAYWCALRNAGGRTRIAYLPGPAHMVCLHYDGPDPWVLDVLADDVYRLSDVGRAPVYELGVRGAIPACWVNGVSAPVPQKWADVYRRLP